MVRPGPMGFEAGVILHDQIAEDVAKDRCPDALLWMEFDQPAVSCGFETGQADLPMGEAFYEERGVEIVRTRRGGAASFHMPGQFSAYTLLRRRENEDFVGIVLRSLLLALRHLHLDAEERRGGPDTGVWVDGRKVAQMGYSLQDGVYNHGFTVNVNNDLEPFEWIVPCSGTSEAVTGVARELGHEIDVDAFGDSVLRSIAKYRGQQLVGVGERHIPWDDGR